MHHVWHRPPRFECVLRQGEASSTTLALPACLETLFEAISTHDAAWPFQRPVSVTDAPDYYQARPAQEGAIGLSIPQPQL